MMPKDMRALSCLVGREAEVARLEQELASVARGQGRVVEVAGDPGIGKSRLLAEMILRAGFRRIRAFSASARDARWHERFGVLVDDLPLQPAGVAGRVIEVVDRYAADGPVVVALDDVHLADGAFAELVTRLYWRVSRRPVLAAIAYRPRQLPGSFRVLLEDGRRSGVTCRLMLSPLGEPDAYRLLGARLSSMERAEYYQVSGGNPLYLQALSRDEDKTVLLADLVGLSDAARSVITAASVSGEPVELGLIRHITGLTEQAVFDAFDELTAHDLLRGQAFRHPLLCQAVYETASPGWARDAHGRAADYLAHREEAPASRAAHVARCARPGDVAAIKLLAEAAAGVEHTEPARAAEWYEAALRLGPRPELAARLRCGLGYALGLSGQIDRACEHYHGGLARLDPSDPLRRRVVGMAATAERMLGRLAESSAILDAELAEGGTAGPGAAPLLLELACHGFIRRKHDQHRRYAELADADARMRGDDGALAAAAVLLCAACCEQPDVPRARSHLEEAQQITDSFTDAQAIPMLSLFTGLGYAAIWLDDYQAAIRHLGRGVRLARQTGQRYILGPLLTLLAEAYLCLGRLTDARQAAADAVMAAGHDQDRITALCRQSEIALWSGDMVTALSKAEDAAAVGDSFKDWSSDIARSHLAAIRAFAGEAGAAEVFCGDSADAALSVLSPLIRSRGYSFLVSAALLSGHREHTEEWATRAEDSARGLGLASASGHAHLARGAVEFPADADQAFLHAQNAAECFRRIGARLNLARATLLAGEALATAGDAERAAREVHNAERVFRSAGAAALADFAAQRRAVITAHGPGSDGAAARRAADASDAPSYDAVLGRLTPRELEVARCIGGGLGNRQIARQLQVREKTVEVHVTRILRKLGVLSRAGVAAIIARAGQ